MGKGALILGASGGIGSALAARLRRDWWQLVLAGRNEEALSLLADTLNAPYRITEGTDLEQVQELCSFAAKTLNGFCGAVNCVGSIFLKPAHLVSESEFTNVLEQNFFTHFQHFSCAASSG
ncbi:MAG: SDR family oxidoreductase [Bdellovibrionales bacterium]|nr:SDR family oxidoreductase [Bdellovibrionales bacterium]